jgi:VWFA-related protein
MIYAIYFKGDSPGGDYQRPMGGGRRGGMGWPGGGYPGGRGGGYPGGGRGGEPRVDGKKVLERMADETGGRLFEMTKKQTADDIYRQIAEELRSQYRLAFTPDAETASDGYHRIDLELNRPDGKTMSIQARDGYYTGK